MFLTLVIINSKAIKVGHSTEEGQALSGTVPAHVVFGVSSASVQHVTFQQNTVSRK